MYVHTNYCWLNEKNPTKHGILIVPYKINHPENFFEKPTNLLQEALNYQDTCSKSTCHDKMKKKPQHTNSFRIRLILVLFRRKEAFESVTCSSVR